MDEYVVVTRDTLEEVTQKTGWKRGYLKSELQDAEYRGCSLVLFTSQGEWHMIFVHNRYNLSWVMRELADRWGLDLDVG